MKLFKKTINNNRYYYYLLSVTSAVSVLKVLASGKKVVPAFAKNNITVIKKKVDIYNKIYNFTIDTFFKKIVRLLLRRGLKLKFFIYFTSAFKLFFYLFLHNNASLFSKNLNLYNMYYAFFNANNTFFNINFLMLWLSAFLEPIFALKCFSSAKRYRKRSGKKYVFSIFFLKKKKRTGIYLKWFFLNIFSFNEKHFYKNIFKSLVDLFLRTKKSKLYARKLIVYKRIFKILTAE